MTLETTRDTKAATNEDSVGGIAYTLTLISLVVLILGLGAAYGAGAWLRAAQERPSDPALAANHLVTIGAQHYIVPAALISDPVQRKDGFSERLDMTLALPLGTSGTLTQIDLTVMPRGRVRTSAGLLDSVYLHQFDTIQLQGPPGLVGKPLKSDAGTTGETVWYDPLSATPFVAKCSAPVAMRPDQRTCLRTVQLSDRNIAVFTFEPSVLYNWRAFDAVVEGWLEGLRK